MAGKRNNPNYNQMTAYVPKEISVKFKSILARLELEQSEVITNLIVDWISEHENEEKQK
jgi:hypothetical protein